MSHPVFNVSHPVLISPARRLLVVSVTLYPCSATRARQYSNTIIYNSWRPLLVNMLQVFYSSVTHGCRLVCIQNHTCGKIYTLLRNYVRRLPFIIIQVDCGLWFRSLWLILNNFPWWKTSLSPIMDPLLCRRRTGLTFVQAKAFLESLFILEWRDIIFFLWISSYLHILFSVKEILQKVFASIM